MAELSRRNQRFSPDLGGLSFQVESITALRDKRTIQPCINDAVGNR
jgi:hypothetical protein